MNNELHLDVFGGFNVTEYWSTRRVKKWYVSIEGGTKRNPKSDTKLVAAKDRDGAIRTAKMNTLLHGRLVIRARLATPWDLGCTLRSES